MDHEIHKKRLEDYSEKSGHNVSYNDGGVSEKYAKEHPNAKEEWAYQDAGRTAKEKEQRGKEISERNASSKGSRGREAKENALGLHMELDKIRDKNAKVGKRPTTRSTDRPTKRKTRS